MIGPMVKAGPKRASLFQRVDDSSIWVFGLGQHGWFGNHDGRFILSGIITLDNATHPL